MCVGPSLHPAKTRLGPSQVWGYFRQRPNYMVLCELCKLELALGAKSSLSRQQHRLIKQLSLE